MSWLGNKLYDTRQWWRETVPEPVRKYARATPLGSLYKTAQAAGVGKALRSGEEATTNPDWTGQFTPISFAPTTPSVSDSGGVTTSAYADYGGGTATPAAPTYAYWMGQQYNLSDPAQAEAYYNARRGFINEQYDYGSTTATRNLNQQLGVYGEDFATNTENLGKAKLKRDVGIKGYFSAIAPNMYQSAEGDELTESKNALTEGQAEARKQNERAKTSMQNWFTDYKHNAEIAKQQELDQVTEAILSSTDSDAVRDRITQTATPGDAPTYTPINIANYFNRLNASLGATPESQSTNMTTPVKGTLATILQKLANNQLLTPEENDMAIQYGIVG